VDDVKDSIPHRTLVEQVVDVGRHFCGILDLISKQELPPPLWIRIESVFGLGGVDVRRGFVGSEISNPQSSELFFAVRQKLDLNWASLWLHTRDGRFHLLISTSTTVTYWLSLVLLH
jgi:hypothetical protein